MKKLIPIFIVLILLLQASTMSVSASGGSPIGGCPPGFDFHPFMDHSGDGMHQHIGVADDLNGDGLICMKIISPDLHLHIDNTFPLN